MDSDSASGSDSLSQEIAIIPPKRAEISLFSPSKLAEGKMETGERQMEAAIWEEVSEKYRELEETKADDVAGVNIVNNVDDKVDVSEPTYEQGILSVPSAVVSDDDELEQSKKEVRTKFCQKIRNSSDLAFVCVVSLSHVILFFRTKRVLFLFLRSRSSQWNVYCLLGPRTLHDHPIFSNTVVAEKGE